MSITCLVLDAASPSPDALESLARSCSPRVEPRGTNAVLLDTAGLARVCGPPADVAQAIVDLAAAQGLTIRLATAGTRTAAWLLAHARSGHTVVAPGGEAAALAVLTLGWLGSLLDLDRSSAEPAADRRRATEAYLERFAVLERWGLRTLGDLAVLPRGDLQSRLGPIGVRLHQAACGEDITPLVPAVETQPFADRLVLEWPIEGLEPLSFVLARQFDRLSLLLDRADRGAVAISTRLTLVTKAVHERILHLPAPIKDAKVLRTLVLLDLESHPPHAAIDVVEIGLEVTPGPIVQGALLAPTLPTVEDVATLVARLGALMGEARVGAPVLVDTYDPRAVAMQPFRLPTSDSRRAAAPDPDAGSPKPEAAGPRTAFRRLRVPLPARVTIERGVPVRVVPSSRGFPAGAVVERAGPWRTSGAWWTFGRSAWDREEWDVALATGGVYRLARIRASGQWEIEGLFD